MSAMRTMKKVLIRAVLLASSLPLLVAGCGSGSGAPLNTGLNTGFAGTWTGTTVITLDYSEPTRGPPCNGSPCGEGAKVDQQIVVVVNGNSMTVPGICPGGAGHWSDPTGTITANGSGDSATWSGSYACPAVTFYVGGCSSGVITYSNLTATLNGAHLTVIATGNVAVGGTADGEQCSASGTATVTFSS